MSWDLWHTAFALAFVGTALLGFAGWERWRDYQ